MLDSTHKAVTEATGFFTSFMMLIQHGEDVLEKLKGLVGIKTFIRRQFTERRHSMSLLTIVNGVTLAEKDALALSAFLLKLPEYAPVIQKQFADLQKATADRGNPVALMADTSVLLADLNTDLSVVVPFITNIIPALKAGTAIPAPSVPPAA